MLTLIVIRKGGIILFGYISRCLLSYCLIYFSKVSGSLKATSLLWQRCKLSKRLLVHLFCLLLWGGALCLRW